MYRSVNKPHVTVIYYSLGCTQVASFDYLLIGAICAAHQYLLIVLLAGHSERTSVSNYVAIISSNRIRLRKSFGTMMR